jgi:RNA polymerase sigma factor (sigma-70 family)
MSTQLKNLSDDALVAMYRSTKTGEALGILFERYSALVYGVCMKYFKDSDTAKDHTMQVFEKLITELPRHEVQFFRAWLYRVAQNQCLLTLRNRKHFSGEVELFADEPVEFMEELHPKAAKEIEYERLELALNDLSVEQRTCIDLFYLQKKSYTDIMQETGFTFMQVKSFIQNGKRNLKNKMTSSGHE